MTDQATLSQVARGDGGKITSVPSDHWGHGDGVHYPSDVSRAKAIERMRGFLLTTIVIVTTNCKLATDIGARPDSSTGEGDATIDVAHGIAVDAGSDAVDVPAPDLQLDSDGRDLTVAEFGLPPSNSWAVSLGAGAITSGANDVVVDNLGASYVAGFFDHTASFGPFSLASSGANDFDAFVAKVSSDGKVVWAVAAGGPSPPSPIGLDWGDRANALAVDASGNTYITGYFDSPASFGTTTLSPQGDSDLFVAKISSDGTFLWVSRAGGSGALAMGNGIAVAADGTIYVTGGFTGTIAADSSHTAAGAMDLLLVALSSDGGSLWSKAYGGSSEDWGSDIAIDANGDLLVTGAIDGPVDFGGQVVVTEGGRDIFVAKLSPVGELLWLVSGGGPSTDEGTAIAVDAVGSAHIIGTYLGPGSFGERLLAPPHGSYDVLVAKIGTGGAVRWATKAGGPDSDRGRGITVDVAGNVYVTGEFKGTATFGATSLRAALPFDSDAFVAKLSPIGQFNWATSAGGNAFDVAASVALDPSGFAIVVGEFGAKASFGGTPLTVLGNFNAFAWKTGLP